MRQCDRTPLGDGGRGRARRWGRFRPPRPAGGGDVAALLAVRLAAAVAGRAARAAARRRRLRLRPAGGPAAVLATMRELPSLGTVSCAMRRTSAKLACAERRNPAIAAANFSENKPLLYPIIRHTK